MEKKCFSYKCRNPAIFLCKCKTPSIYFCKAHDKLHKMTEGVHVTDNVAKPRPQNSEKILRITKALASVSEIREKLGNEITIIFEFLIGKQRGIQQKLGSLEKNIRQLLSKVMKDGKLSSSDLSKLVRYEEIKAPSSFLCTSDLKTPLTLFFSSVFLNLKSPIRADLHDISIYRYDEPYLKSSISTDLHDNPIYHYEEPYFKAPIKTDLHDKIIFYDESYRLKSLSLDTFNISPLTLTNSPSFGYGATFSKIDEDSFIFAGGFNQFDQECQGCSIINLKTNHCQNIDSIFFTSLSGSVVKQNFLYIFGGLQGRCSKYSLTQKKWSEISSLHFVKGYAPAVINEDCLENTTIKGINSLSNYQDLSKSRNRSFYAQRSSVRDNISMSNTQITGLSSVRANKAASNMYTNPGARPKPFHCNTAVVCQEDILLTGFSLEGVYFYNESSDIYTIEHKFEPNSFKYLFENWLLVAGNLLYKIEINGQKRDFFGYHKANWSGAALFLSGSLRKGIFIYFLTANTEVFRINTEIGKFEKFKLDN